MTDPTWEIMQADVLEGLATLPSESVHCVVTSPPYLGLRDYGVEGAIGLEATPEEYICKMVEVFREVWRVMRPDASLWLNLGDSYAGAGDRPNNGGKGNEHGQQKKHKTPDKAIGLKPKDLMMMPARVALALQADGYYLRSEITWCKRAPMPESVRDRPTSATEKIYLLTKSASYFYDAEAVREAHAEPWRGQGEHESHTPHNGRLDDPTGKQQATFTVGTRVYNPAGRNQWNYWLLAPEPYAAAHFATFPTEIPRRAILAGTSAKGCCSECGAPWRRVVKSTYEHINYTKPREYSSYIASQGAVMNKHNSTIGWQPSCPHTDAPLVPATVLDPFAGAGTTLLVALRHGRSALGIELNPEYVRMAQERIVNDAPMFNAQAAQKI